MTVYHLPDDVTFIKTIIEQGQGLYAPNEGRDRSNNFYLSIFSANLGSNCKIIIKFSPANYSLTENLYNDLLPFNEEIKLNLGFYSTIIGSYVHKCLITMKQNELAQLKFHYENEEIELSIYLISFERSPEIYSLSIDNLYDFALKHKENANKFFREKQYSSAFKLYHRSLCYILNFLTEPPTDDYLDKINQLILSIYSNMSACQLISGNNPGVITNCTSALEIDPKCVKALYRRGTAYGNLNDYELALKDLQLAHEIGGNDRNIDDLLRTTKQRLEQYNKTLGQSLKNLF